MGTTKHNDITWKNTGKWVITADIMMINNLQHALLNVILSAVCDFVAWYLSNEMATIIKLLTVPMRYWQFKNEIMSKEKRKFLVITAMTESIRSNTDIARRKIVRADFTGNLANTMMFRILATQPVMATAKKM